MLGVLVLEGVMQEGAIFAVQGSLVLVKEEVVEAWAVVLEH